MTKKLRVSLTTSGGFTGRGVGSVTIDGADVVVDERIVSKLTADEEAMLRQLAPMRPHTARPTPDAITYTVDVGGISATFTDLDECEWIDALMSIRERVIHGSSAM